MPLHIVILAAGQGTRMFSNNPKVLHTLAGVSLLERVVQKAKSLNPESIHVIVGHGKEKITETLAHLKVHWVTQTQQLGTGHALSQALPFIPEDAQVLVLCADVPLIQEKTLVILLSNLEKKNPSPLALLVTKMQNPSGFGRIIRNTDNAIEAIVEEKDATLAQKNIQEIYTGICAAVASDLTRWLGMCDNNNAQKEYYLTDIIKKAALEKHPIQSHLVEDCSEVQGVNNRLQLEQLERIYQLQQAQTLMLQGVTLVDASRVDVRGELICGQDVFIDVNCIFIGRVVVADGCKIGPNCVLENTTLEKDCVIFANSVLDGTHLESHCHVGPFARLRPGTRLSPHCKIGNFVETKNIKMGDASKASHLSYLGDALIGKQVNIGAGTITCNYDGVNKHQTIIEDGAFIGSDTQLIAPVTIGANATLGAGSTIRKNAPAGELTLTETKQKTVYGWKRPIKKS